MLSGQLTALLGTPFIPRPACGRGSRLKGGVLAFSSHPLDVGRQPDRYRIQKSQLYVRVKTSGSPRICFNPSPVLAPAAKSSRFPTFIKKLEDGSIPLPCVRLNGSQKGKQMIPLNDLASYIDEIVERARRECSRK